jgi:hypothetical protein
MMTMMGTVINNLRPSRSINGIVAKVIKKFTTPFICEHTNYFKRLLLLSMSIKKINYS